VEGTDKGRVFLYTLSACGWCKATKQVLSELGVAYQYLDVDLLPPVEKEQVLQEIKPWDPQSIFPALVIGTQHLVGFLPEETRKLLK
jgi:glutaredoxin-like protein NrdH